MPDEMARAGRTNGAEARNADEPASVKSDKSSPHDTLNRAIIEMLQRDGRMPYSEIADALDVSEGTIRNRVNGMKQAGGLRIVAVVDPVSVEYETDAMLGLKLGSGYRPDQVAERLSQHSDVVYILWVSGRFDLLVELVSNEPSDVLEFLANEIYASPDIAECDVMTGLKNFKNQFLLKRSWT